MIGRVDLIEARPAAEHWKARGLDLRQLLAVAAGGVRRRAAAEPRAGCGPQRHARRRRCMDACAPALDGRVRCASARRCAMCIAASARCSAAKWRAVMARPVSPTAASRSSSTARPASRSAPGSRRGSRSRCAARPTTTWARASRAAGWSSGRRGRHVAAARGQHHRRQRRAVRRHQRRGVHPRCRG